MIRAALAIAALPLLAVSGSGASDPLLFFSPHVQMTVEDRALLARGEAIVRIIPARERHIAVFAVGRVQAPAEALLTAIRNISDWKRGPFVHAIGRFSVPPRLEDVNALELDEVDLEAIYRCRPHACKVKLGAEEIARFQKVIAAAGERWRAAVQQEFRELVVARVRAYMSRGHHGIPDYYDHAQPDNAARNFERIMEQSAYLRRELPDLAEYLVRYPAAPHGDTESFLYWSKEKLALKPVIGVTHVVLAPGQQPNEPAIVAAKQVFGTHYADASLGLTAMLTAGDGTRYLGYLNRSWVDGLEGMLGGIKRSIVERRMQTEIANLFEEQRKRLERAR